MGDAESGLVRLRDEAQADLSRVVDELVRITNLSTRWRGTVVVRGPEFPHAGQKHGWCGISLREDILAIPEWRWATMIHEGLHSVSAGAEGSRLDPWSRRWEEAIAEQTQRLLRGELLTSLHVELDEHVLRARDGSHRYNAYIRALEIQRTAEGSNSREFYLKLLGSSPQERVRMLITALRAVSTRRELDW